MEIGIDLLHKDMLADIQRCLSLEHPEKENVESCFWIAKNYWDQLQVMIKMSGFRNDGEEISFYKVVKPKFASYIEYFSLLSEGLLFEPSWVPFPEGLEGKIEHEAWRRTWQESVNDYWTNEEKRGQRFYKKNLEIINYCESGRLEKDEEYFLPRNSVAVEMPQRRSHNRDSDFFTVQEEILTTWQAYKLYSAYIKKKVNEHATL